MYRVCNREKCNREKHLFYNNIPPPHFKFLSNEMLDFCECRYIFTAFFDHIYQGCWIFVPMTVCLYSSPAIYYKHAAFHFTKHELMDDVNCLWITRQPYHLAAQDWLPTEAKQGWSWSVPGWVPPGKTRLLLEEVLVRPAGGAHPVVCLDPNSPV